MEPPPLDIGWEVRRVVAAFGLAEWERLPDDENALESGTSTITGLVGDQSVSWAIWANTGKYTAFGVRDSGGSTSVFQNNAGVWRIHFSANPHNELLTRGLYRLGFEDEGVLSQLPPLSAHEKMELRLSLPREFWPKTWIEEES